MVMQPTNASDHAERANSVSVIVPCFNAARWIRATLRSVYAQGWPDLEVIAVDDGSSDDTVEIVRREFPHVIVVRQRNSGVAVARNTGIAKATREWIAFIDADDIWLPGKLAAQWEALDKSGGARMCCSSWEVWQSDDPDPTQELVEQLCRAGEGGPEWDGPSGWIYPALLLSSHVWTSTVLAQRSLFAQIGVFDDSLRIGEDLDLWLRASRVTPIIRVKRPLALYRMHPGSITKGAPRENYQALVLERAIARWGYTSPDGGKASPTAVSRAIAATWRDFAGAHLVSGSPQRALHGAWMSVRKEWGSAAGWLLLFRSAVKALVQRRGAAA